MTGVSPRGLPSTTSSAPDGDERTTSRPGTDEARAAGGGLGFTAPVVAAGGDAGALVSASGSTATSVSAGRAVAAAGDSAGGDQRAYWYPITVPRATPAIATAPTAAQGNDDD